MSDPKNKLPGEETGSADLPQSRKGKEPNKLVRFGLLGLMGLLSLVLVAGAAGIIYAASLWSKVQKPAEETGEYTIPSELMNETDENGDPIVMTLAPPTQPEMTQPSETELSTEEETEPGEEETLPEESSAEEMTTEAETTEEETTEEATTEEEPTTEEPTTETQTDPPAPTRETYNWESKIPSSWEIDPSVAAAMSDYFNFVIFGVDARNNSSITIGAQGDVIMIVSIKKSTKEVKLLSIYRDTLSAYSNLTNYGKITNVYRVNGAAQVMDVINYTYDLRLSNYVAVNWKALADVVNIMGGLDISISAAEARKINEYQYGIRKVTGLSSKHVDEVDGIHHLDGVAVVAYCRIRKVGNADYQRTERQRTVINLMLARAKTMSLGQLNAAANALFGEIGTNFGLAEILSMLSDVKSYRIVDSGGFPYQYNSDSTIYIRDLVANVSQMHAYLFGNGNYTPSLAVYTMGQNFAELHRQHFGW